MIPILVWFENIIQDVPKFLPLAAELDQSTVYGCNLWRCVDR